MGLRGETANRTGFTLVESLIALTLFALILLAALGFFGTAQKAFFRLRDTETAQESALAALERIKTDLLQAGKGLGGALELGIIPGIEARETNLIIRTAARTIGLQADVSAGTNTITVSEPDELGAGKEVCLLKNGRGEAGTIVSVSGRTMTLGAPVSESYPSGESKLLLLEKIAYSLDSSKTTLRRKINASSAQPLVEGIAAFTSGYDETGNLASVRLGFQGNSLRTFNLTVFPKNIALSGSH